MLVSRDQDFAEVSIEPPHGRDESWRPTVLMERVAAVIEQHGPLAARKIETLVTGKAASIREAVTFLQVDGYLSDDTPHRLLKPYPAEGSTR